jgi:hypothetical protein
VKWSVQCPFEWCHEPGWPLSTHTTAPTHYLPAGTHATNQESNAVCEMKRGTYRLGPVSSEPVRDGRLAHNNLGLGLSWLSRVLCQLERPYICPRPNPVVRSTYLLNRHWILMLLYLF